jgi:hypothetical protein
MTAARPAPARYTYDYVLRLLMQSGVTFEQAHRIAAEFPV